MVKGCISSPYYNKDNEKNSPAQSRGRLKEEI
jgi:hypothetical protein